jgi:SmpA / OmlA family
MNNPSESTGARTWARFLRLKPQFRLRLLFFTTMIVAGCLWTFLNPEMGIISEAQAARVTNEMTQAQIKAILGRPGMVEYFPHHTRWSYRFESEGQKRVLNGRCFAVLFRETGEVDRSYVWVNPLTFDDYQK